MFAFFVFMIGLMIILSIIGAILSGIGTVQDRSYTKKTFNELIQQNNITNYYHYRTDDGSYLIDDKGDNYLYVITPQGWVKRGYEHVTGVELRIDDSVAYQSNLSSMAGRAVVGGVLAGGLGAVIGGATGRKDGRKVAHRIDLIISFNTPNKPYVKVSFLNDKQGTDIFSDYYQRREEQALYWSKLIESLMPRKN